MTQPLQTLIDNAWEARADLSAQSASPEIRDAVEQVLADLNAGRLRVAEQQGVGQWTVNQWVKKAVLLSFRLNDNRLISGSAGGASRSGLSRSFRSKVVSAGSRTLLAR